MNEKKQNKLKTKDIITIVLLTLINLVIYALTSFMYILPITVLMMPIYLSLFNSIVFFILGTKVKKRGAIFIYCTIMGVLGVYPPYIFAYIATGLIAELILSKTGYGSFKGLSISYIIIQISASIASTFYPYMLAMDSLLEGMTEEQLASAEQLSQTEAARMLSSGGFVVVFVAVVIAAFAGCFIGSRIVKKHLSTMKNTSEIAQ